MKYAYLLEVRHKLTNELLLDCVEKEYKLSYAEPCQSMREHMAADKYIKEVETMIKYQPTTKAKLGKHWFVDCVEL